MEASLAREADLPTRSTKITILIKDHELGHELGGIDDRDRRLGARRYTMVWLISRC